LAGYGRETSEKQKPAFRRAGENKLCVALHPARAQAARANIDATGRAVHDRADALNVGLPGALRLNIGMAHVISMSGFLITVMTGHRHFSGILLRAMDRLKRQNTSILSPVVPFGKQNFKYIAVSAIKSLKNGLIRNACIANRAEIGYNSSYI
jgi:hypothetical protein